jgi:hypothetical protein
MLSTIPSTLLSQQTILEEIYTRWELSYLPGSNRCVYCRWEGLSCEDKTAGVTTIQLSFKSIQGKLPTKLGLLSGFKELSLY